MVNISLTDTKLVGTVTGEVALYDTVTVQFSGKIFPNHTYYIIGAEQDKTPLTAWIAATRSPSELFVYADIAFDSVDLETYLSTQYKRSLYLWLFDDTADEFVGYGVLSIMAAPTPAGLVRYTPVIELPASPTAGMLYYLTVADDTYLAPAGVYLHNGVGWNCISYLAKYSLGNWSGTTVKALIPGVDYSATLNGNLTAGWGITMTVPGSVRVRVTNGSGYTVATPAGTVKKKSATGLANLNATLAEWNITYDGTTQDWITEELLTP